MKKAYVPDATDQAILEMLKNDSRLQWRQIGESVHMTGQAVGERIRRMVAAGIIERFTIDVKEEVPGRVDFVTLIMKTNDHEPVLNIMRTHEAVLEAHRIGGAGCYAIKTMTKDGDALDAFLEQLLPYANYSLSSVVKTVR